MSRVFTLVVALTLVVACENKGNDQAGDSAQGAGTPGGIQLQTPSGRPMIPDEELSAFEKLANGHIRPYFDEQGTVTELAVAPGEQFDIWIFVEFNTTHPMSAAEYRLIVPDGVKVIASANLETVLVAMGRWNTDFSIAFHCLTGPKHSIVRYFCLAEENFAGGTVRTARGQVQDYIGFTMCDQTKTMIRAKSSEAVLTKK